MLRAYTRSKRMKEAVALFDRMGEFGLVPDKYAYTALLWGAGYSGQWHLAEDIFENLERTGMAFDGITYRTLIETYERHGQWGKAMKVLERMRGPRSDAPRKHGQGRMIEY